MLYLGIMNKDKNSTQHEFKGDYYQGKLYQSNNEMEKLPPNYIEVLKNVPIELLDLPKRCFNGLKRVGVNSVYEVVNLINNDQLGNIRYIGRDSARIIIEKTDLYIKGHSPSIETKSSIEQNNKTIGINTLEEFAESKQLQESLPDFIKNIPIFIFKNQLPKGTVDRLESICIKSIDDLFSFLSDLIYFFSEDENINLRIFDACIEYLQSCVQNGSIHSKARIAGTSLKKLFEARSMNDADIYRFIEQFIKFTEQKNLDEELKQVFSCCSDRYIEIYILRNVKNYTYQQIGEYFGITRERVRQILNLTNNKLSNNMNNLPMIFLQSSFLFAEEMGEDLSKTVWRSTLLDKKIVSGNIVLGENDAFDILCALIKDSASLPAHVSIPRNVKQIINSKEKLKNLKALSDLTTIQKKKIQRIVNFTGGIHISQASEIVGIDPESTADLLNSLGYKEIIDNWFSLKSVILINSRNPILNAGLSMINACGELKFETFCDGIRRYISRNKYVISPNSVMLYFLQLLGFSIQHDIVYYDGHLKGNLTGSEKIFLELIKEKGPVISFQEIIDRYLKEGYSASTATLRIMGLSPIVERVDEGLYILRGSNYSFQDVETSRSRQEIFSKDAQVSYCLDGTIKYVLNVNTWAYQGVISISRSCQQLPSLDDGWPVYINGLQKGKALRNESLIWGLGPAFNAIGIMNGDRIELTFDSREAPKIFVRKINE